MKMFYEKDADVTSNVDPIYKEAFNKAVESGVEIIPLQIGWNIDGTAEFICDNLPVNKN